MKHTEPLGDAASPHGRVIRGCGRFGSAFVAPWKLDLLGWRGGGEYHYYIFDVVCEKGSLNQNNVFGD